MAKKAKKSEAGAPEWMVTFGDMMSLLLCFFVIIVSLSEIKRDDRYQMVMESLRHAFGNTGEIRAVMATNMQPNTLLKRLRHIVIPTRTHKGDADDPGVRGRVFRVTDVREGIHVEIGGRISFARFSATLRDEARFLIAQVAEKTIGHNTIIKVTGHATREPLPRDSVWVDAWNLSYARARAVSDVLIDNGIRPARIRLVAAGAESPVRQRAYTEEDRTLNRRVEIVVTEATIQDYQDDTVNVAAEDNAANAAAAGDEGGAADGVRPDNTPEPDAPNNTATDNADNESADNDSATTEEPDNG